MPQIIQPTSNPAHENFLEAWKRASIEEARDYLRKDIIMADEGLRFITETARC